MKQYLKELALLLTIIGSIKWLTFAAFDLNLVNYIFGRCCPAIEKVVYIVVGLSSIYAISLFQELCSAYNNSNEKNDIHRHSKMVLSR